MLKLIQTLFVKTNGKDEKKKRKESSWRQYIKFLFIVGKK